MQYTKNFSIIHFIPSLLVFISLISLIVSIFYKPFFNVLLVIVVAYTLFLFVQGIIGVIKIKNPLAFFVMIVVTLTTHISYGLGLMYKVFLLLVNKKEKEVSG